MSTALTLYEIEDDLRALVDTAEGGVEEDQRLAILDEIAERTDQAVAKRDNLIRFLRHLELSQAAAKAEVGRITALADTWARAQERIERYVISIIERCVAEPRRGPKKLEGSLGVLALHKNPDRVGGPGGAKEPDLDLLPAEYQDVTVTLPAVVWEQVLAVLPEEGDYEPRMFGQKFVARKTEIKAAIQAGAEVPGAELVFGANRLEVR
jgi:hypothetical protein